MMNGIYMSLLEDKADDFCSHFTKRRRVCVYDILSAEPSQGSRLAYPPRVPKCEPIDTQ